MVEIKPIIEDLDILVARIFLKAIENLGGFSKLAEFRTLTWLPSLARACYVVVLREEQLKTAEEIASIVGLTKQTVQNILRADIELALEKLRKVEDLVGEEGKELKVHTAGGLAKLAYKQIKEGKEEPKIILEYAMQVSKALDIPWAYLLLRKLKGADFPIENKDVIIEKVKDIYIKGRKAEEVLSEIDYPIKTPAELLHKIKENLKMHGLE